MQDMTSEQTLSRKPAVVSIGRGAGWLLEGFHYFSKAPIPWIGAMLLLFVIYVALGLIPILGNLAAQILMPVFFAGLLIGCHAQYNGGEFSINHLFAGFSQNTSQLVMLGVIYTGFVILILLVMLVILFTLPGGLELAEQMEAGDVESLRKALRTASVLLLVSLGLMLPLWMAYWFAPILVVLDDLSPVQAMKTSFMACLYNIIPFTLYGLVLLVLFFIASIPFLLGLLVLLPMASASVFIAYRDIFKSAES